MSKPTRQKMCQINPKLVPLITPLVGSQSEIMVRVGISWNSWNKILDGQSIRCSMAERFRAKILSLAVNMESFAAAYPAADGGLDAAALEADFIKPITVADAALKVAAAPPEKPTEITAEKTAHIAADQSLLRKAAASGALKESKREHKLAMAN